MSKPPFFPLDIRTIVVLFCFVGIGYAQTFTTFDVPDSSSVAPVAINPAGQIAGYYGVVASSITRGFLRNSDGTLVTFEVPGSASTVPGGINPAGEITGYYVDSGFRQHGFLRKFDGTLITFDVPGSLFTFSRGINPTGKIVGFYLDGSQPCCLQRGFVRDPDGTFLTFDVSGSNVSPVAINPAGLVIGKYFNDKIFRTQGFLRRTDGSITTVDPEDSTLTVPTAINPAGQITGWYVDNSDKVDSV
jgi:hypothetical protein